MSEKRTLETIRREYAELCSRAGHIYYTIEVSKKDLDLVTAQLKDLNLEAAKAQAEESTPKEA